MKVLLTLLFGFLAGATLTALFSPSVISWYFDPPTSIGVPCKEAVVWGINAYQKMVFVGGALGLIVGLVSVIVLKTRKSPKVPTNQSNV